MKSLKSLFGINILVIAKYSDLIYITKRFFYKSIKNNHILCTFYVQIPYFTIFVTMPTKKLRGEYRV